MPSVEGMDDDDDTGSHKRKRGQPGKSWRLPSGAPVVPQAVYHNVENSLIKFNVRKRKEFVQEACKYWTLKREARRGAALLKRLQLQMEAFSSMEITRRNFVGMGAAGRPRLQRRIEFAERLEDDMEQIRVLCEMVKQREAEKLKDVLVLKSIVDSIYLPIPQLLEPILDRAISYDGKGVFSEGFAEIQAKIDEKYYTSVQAFSEDMAAVFSSVIDFATITDVGDAEYQMSGVAHNSLTSEQKEKKKLAKRIIKAVQPLFETAKRKESDLTGRPYETEIPDLETLLNQRLRRQSAASTIAPPAPPTEPEQLDLIGDDEDAPGEEESIPGDVAEELAKRNAHLAPTPEDNINDGQHHGAEDDAANEVAIAAQLGQDAMHASSGDRQGDAMEVDHVGGNVQTEPLTPPRSEKNMLGPLANGGVPWYLQNFEIRGTTVHEEPWKGRELLRDMSEELSDMDDDELDGLVDVDAMQAGDGSAAEIHVSQEGLQKARKKQRRARAYR